MRVSLSPIISAMFLLVTSACGQVKGTTSDATVTPASCSDQTLNGMETDLDCGGPQCGPCADNHHCVKASDCTSGVCTGTVCQAPSCTDGVRNGNEIDVDCGGACGNGSCRVGQACNGDNALCMTMFCTNNVCVAPKHVFVTSVRYSGNLGGLTGADQKCQSLATAAGLAGTYKAWLSSSGEDAATHNSHGTGPYVLTDGTKIANDWADLTDGTLANAINKTETRGAPPASDGVCDTSTDYVITGSRTDGTIYDANCTCSNWTSTTGCAGWGRYTLAGSSWTLGCGGGTSGFCAKLAPIYCFEQ